ncbi:MAG: branched-chain amino acid ABC transporter permease [Candidatus Bathyarchaeia archaeon]
MSASRTVGLRLMDKRVLGAAFFVSLALVVSILSPDAFLYILGLTYLFMTITVSWDVMVGYTGQVNLGHIVFVGIGAYTTALLQTPSRLQRLIPGILFETSQVPIYVSILCGGIAAAIFGLIIGVITLRLKGWYFALVTAVLPLVFMETTVIWKDVFGGEEGFSVGLKGALASSTVGKYYVAFAFMLGSVAAMYAIANSKVGLKFKAVREDSYLAESVGIDTVKVKVLAFMVSSFFAGLAGALIVHYRGTVSPSLYDVPLMLLIILAAVIGGLGTVFGPMVGGLIVYLAKHWWLKGAMAALTSTGLPLNDDIILYAVLIAMAVLLPEGIWIRARKIIRRA